MMKAKTLMLIALLCLPFMGLEAWAQFTETYEKSYVECSWDATTQSVVKTVKYFNLHATYSVSSPNSWIKLENPENYGIQHWVFDGSNLEFQGIEVPAGEAQHIILKDGTNLTVQRIKLEEGATLHIHAQQGQNGSIGTLNITGNTNAGAAGIGSSYGANAGDLIIHGGAVIVNNPQTSAAGIGGGDGGEAGGGGNGGKVTIYDGVVRVKASNKGAAIGGGHYGNGGDVKIYGGDIMLQSGSADDPTIGHGRDATNNGSVSFGLLRVYKGTRTEGEPTFADAPVYRTKRTGLCNSSYPVHITPCTTHQCINSRCDHCGYQTENPEGLTYLNRSWDEKNKQVKEELVTVTDARNIAEFLPFDNQSVDYWANPEFGYNNLVLYVKGDLDMSKVKWFNQYNTKLILCNESELKIRGILLNGPFVELSIFGQQGETGKLLVNQTQDGETGICANGEGDVTIRIHSGRVEAYGAPGRSGIGTQSKYPTSDKVYIYGGTVYAEGGGTATGDLWVWLTGYGIGGGGMTTTIYDGYVEAHGVDRGSGIGYGTTIYGGTVKAYGGDNGAGIGGTMHYDGLGVYIHGGTVIAEGGYRGAGIGGGYEKGSGNVTITGGTVQAKGGEYAAGIGGGANQDPTFLFRDITISGGTVYAYGGIDGAGIGGGEDGECEQITISGGYVYAEGKGNAVGIGAGEDGDSHTITITGGTVIAKCGNETISAIGSNLDNEHKGTLTLPDNYKVNAGTDENNIERRFTNAERVPACFYRRYAEISECAHDVPTRGSDQTAARSYTISGDNQHIIHCRYCNDNVPENHSYNFYDVCEKCGHELNSFEDECIVDVYQAVVWPYEPNAGTLQYVKTSARVLKGSQFNITTEQDVEGLVLQAFVLNPETAPTEPWLTDAEKTSQTNFIDPSQPFYPTENTKIYARYRLDFTTRWVWGTDSYGFIDGNNVKLYIANKWVNNGEEIEFTKPQVEVVVDETNRANDDVIYTATVNYNYPDASVTYTFTDVKHTPYYLPAIALDKNGSNYWTVNKYDGKTVDVKLLNRTLYHDNTWNTIYLPFALSAEQLADEDCPLHGATIKKLEDCSFANGTLTLTFTENSLTETEAGVPYIVKWPAVANPEVTDPEFKNVTVSKDMTATTIVKDQTYGIGFMGSYDPSEISADIVALKAMLYLGADNNLYYPNAPMTIGANQCYFYLYGLTAGDPESPAQGAINFAMNFGDEGTTEIISNTNRTNYTNTDAWYDLHGHKLNGKPSRAGIYINNGRKVVVK